MRQKRAHLTEKKESRFELHILCLPDVATKYPMSLNLVSLSSVLCNAYTKHEMVGTNLSLKGEEAHLWLLCQSS